MHKLLPHLQHKKHVIFDYNGTILHDTELCLQTLNELLDERQLPHLSLADYRQRFFFPIVDFYRSLGFNCTKEEFSHLSAKYNQIYKDNIDQTRLYEGIHELIAELRAKNIVVSILTALNHDELQSQLALFQLTAHFDYAWGLPDYHAHSKVQLGVDLMKHVGIPAEDTIMLGDTLHDLEVAQHLKIEVLLLSDGHQTEARLKEAHDKVFSRYSPF